MANIEGAIRIDDSRIPVATSLDGALLIGLANGKTTAVPTELLKESAYLLAQQEGYTGTLTEWLESLVGNSAYEDWLAQGGAGSFEDFVNSIYSTVNLLLPLDLTEAQKKQALGNIGAITSKAVADVNEYNEIAI